MQLVFCGKKFYQKRFSDYLEHGDKFLRGNSLMSGYFSQLMSHLPHK